MWKLVSVFLFLILSIGVAVVAANDVIIEGYVTDAATGDPLPGANVFIVGTSLGAASDVNGKYRISRVPPGSYTLRTTYIGYQTLDLTVKTSLASRVRQDFKLDYVSIKGDVVTVTAQAEGQMAAINQQLTARAIVNVVSSDRIQELPDANAAESVGRLPGVSVLREGGEGNKIVIRGLSPKYNAVMVEGVRMAATDFEDRSADLSMISPYMLEGIEVMKAITPDQDADILGGSVNFIIREASDGLGEGARISYDLIARGGYNGLKDTYGDYKVVGTVSTRLFDSRLGILGQVDVERRDRSSHEMGAGYGLNQRYVGQKNPVLTNNLNLKDIIRDKDRIGGTMSIDYRLRAGKISLKNLFSFADTRTISRNESYGIEARTHSYSATDSHTKLNVMTNVLGYEQTFPLLRVDVNISHSRSENHIPNSLSFRFTEDSALPSGVGPGMHPSRYPPLAVNDFHFAHFINSSESNKLSQERQVSASANVEMDFGLSRQFSGKLKFGVKYRYQDRSFDTNSAGGTFNLGSAQDTRNRILNAFPWMKETVPTGSGNLPYTLFWDLDYDAGDFLNGEYPLNPPVDIDLMHAVMDVVRQSKELQANRNYNSISNDYSGFERIGAGYIMADMNIWRTFKIIPGVRYEQARTSYLGFSVDNTYPGASWFDTGIDTTTVRKNGFWLPMVHLQYKPAEWFDIRFAYTNTLSRPNYQHIMPRTVIGLTSVSWHNYKLKPSRSQNFDLYVSIHENHVGLFTVGGFLKKIDDLIFGTGTKIILDPSAYDLDPWHEGKTISTQINNERTVDLWGIEVDWQTHFWYLPGLLKGIIINANYTHILSEAQYPKTIIETEYLFEPPWVIKTNVDTTYAARLLHQPNDILNLALGYDFKDFSVRLSILYQSNIFKGANFWPELRRYTDDYLRWDLSIKQDLPWYGLQFYCNVNNITSALDRDLNQGTRFPAAEQHYGKTADLGLRLRL